MPTAKPFSQELLVGGAVLLSFLAQLVVQTLWSQGDKSREAIAELQKAVGTLATKIDHAQAQIDEQSGILRQLVEGNGSREARIAKLEVGIVAAEKSLGETNALIARQLQRIEAQIADLQRAVLQRQGR